MEHRVFQNEILDVPKWFLNTLRTEKWPESKKVQKKLGKSAQSSVLQI